MFHYTDKAGYNGISSQSIWKFLASKPPGDNPEGAYFTTLSRDEKNLCARLRIPRTKVEYVFSFSGDNDLEPLNSGRGRGMYIYWSAIDYLVGEDRQDESGKTEEL